MKKFTRFFIYIIVVTIFFYLTSCTKGNKAIGGNENKTTLKLWNIWAVDTENQKRSFEEILNSYKKKNKQIVFDVETYENETYKTKIKTAMASNETPDIFFTWGSGFAKPFINANRVLALDKYLNPKTLDSIKPGMTDNFLYNGNLYGLPMYGWVAILYCNKELFEKNNLKIPDTYDELVQAVNGFNKNNIRPILIGEKERWPGAFFQNILAIRLMGTKTCEFALEGKVSFNQPEFVESAKKLSNLVNIGAFGKYEEFINMTKDESESEFKMGKAAMYYMGNWASASWDSDDSSIKGKVICKNFPIIEGSYGSQNAFLGGAIDTFMVSNETLYKSESVKAIEFISKNMSIKSNIIGYGIPAWKGTVDKKNLSPMNSQIDDLVNNNNEYFLAWDTILEGEAAEEYKNLVTEIFKSSIKPEGFAEGMQNLNKKEN